LVEQMEERRAVTKDVVGVRHLMTLDRRGVMCES